MHRHKPYCSIVSLLFNISSASIITWLFIGFEPQSGMEGMLDGLIEILFFVSLTALGLLLGLIALYRKEQPIAFHYVNLIYSAGAVMIIALAQN